MPGDMEEGETVKITPYAQLAQNLYKAVQQNDVTAARHLVKGLNKDSRKRISGFTFEGNTPMFLAAKLGHTHMAKHLLEDWHADIEKKGVYEVASDHSKHQVTPLWCAAVADRLEVVKILVEHGADINAPSDTQSTPVRSACYMTNIKVIKYLVEKGSDIHKPNHNGGTCLINAVQSAELCQFLIQHGVDVNAKDNSGNLALHYAIREGRMESVKLLLSNGSDAFLKNDLGDDALITASLRGYSEILDYLIDTIKPPKIQMVNAYELMATNFVDEKHDLQSAIDLWRRTMTMRHGDQTDILHKPEPSDPNPAYLGMNEARDLAQLEEIATNPDAVYIQSLLTRERILGPDHKDTVFGLMYRGAVYADTHQYQRCVDLWKYAFTLRQNKEEPLSSECVFTLQALCKLFWEIHDEFAEGYTREPVRYDDVMDVFKMAAAEVMRKREAPVRDAFVQPVSEPEEEKHTMLLLVLHLLHLLCKISAPHQEGEVKEYLVQLLRAGVHGLNGRSLLHLAADKKSCTVSEEFYSHFPAIEVINMLIDCGSNVNVLDQDRNSVLHVCAEGLNQLLTQRKYRETLEEIVGVLLENGAHIDIVNKRGINACMLLQNRCPSVRVFEHITLKCLAARVVRAKRIQYRDGVVPYTLVPFIDLH